MNKNDFLNLAMKRFDLCCDQMIYIREDFLDDIKFLNGEQWEEVLKRERAEEKRPALTINRLPASHNQVVNDFRQNRPAIKARAVDDYDDPDKADVINGILKRIQNNGDSKTAIDSAFYYSTGGGFGFIRVKTDYLNNESFDQEIFIERIENPCTVYFPIDLCTQPDYSDAPYCFVRLRLSKEDFKAQYPNADMSCFEKSGVGDSSWVDEEFIHIAEYFWVEEKTTYLTLLSDDSKVMLKEKPIVGQLVDGFDDLLVAKIRETTKREIHRALITENDILEPDAIFAGNWIPIVPMLAQEINVDGVKRYISLTRFAKDPQKMFNYWNSAFTEQIALAPKSPWLIAEGQVEGYENIWKSANIKNYGYLPYHPLSHGGQQVAPPQRIEPPTVGSAIITGIQYAADNLKATTGIFDASLGAQGNETSGRAINARQRQGSVTNYHFTDNASRCLKHLGRIIKDLIPIIYDRPDRVVRILGEDMKDKVVAINRSSPDSDGRLYDVTVGDYDIIIDTGASYETKRLETSETLIQLTQNNPIFANIAPDILVQNLDFAGRDNLQKRLKRYLKMQMPSLLEGEETPEEAEKTAQQQAQMQQALEQAQAQLQQATEQIQNDQAQMQQMNQAIAKLEQTINTLQMQLKNKDNELSIKLEIERMKNEVDRLKISAESRNKELEQTILAAKNDVDQTLKAQELYLKEQQNKRDFNIKFATAKSKAVEDETEKYERDDIEGSSPKESGV